MVDKTRQQALEILANPLAKEKEWTGALAILGGKVSVQNRRIGFKLKRFGKRVLGLLLIQTTIFYMFSLFSGYTFTYQVFANVLMWTVAEVAFGGFTILASLAVVENIQAILLLSPVYLLAVVVALTNILVFRHFHFKPYALVPVENFVRRRSPKRIGTKS